MKEYPYPAMNAYLFTDISTVSQICPTQGRYGRAGESFQSWDGCSSLSILAENADVAQQQFVDWLNQQPEGEHPRTVKIHKIAAAQYVDQLLTETGAAPLDWPKMQAQAQAQIMATAEDDFEQDFWVDVEQVVRPRPLSRDITALQQSLPEDIRTGLNWLPDKQFFFRISVFSTPPPPLAWSDTPVQPEAEDEAVEAGGAEELQRLLAQYPEGADMEAAALILARNSVVAAWLWRRYAADTRLAANPIRIGQWTGAMGIEPVGTEE